MTGLRRGRRVAWRCQPLTDMFDIILVAAITLLAILLATRRGQFRNAGRSRSWPHVRGHVIESTRTEWMHGFLPMIRYR